MELKRGANTLELRAERAVFWRERRMLIVADCHFGKAATFRHHGLAVPEGGTQDDLDRLTHLLARTGAERLIVVGDLFHAPAGYREEVLEPLIAWRQRHHAVEFVLVPGNHDLRLDRLPARLAMRVEPGPMTEAPFAFVHTPDEAIVAVRGRVDALCLCGHLHPAVRLAEPRIRGVSVPCFWLQREKCLVLPSFGAFTGSAIVSPVRGDRVFAITGERVREIPGSLLGLG